MNDSQPLPVVVLISGSGSNLQALIDAQLRGCLPIEIRAVISNRADAPGLTRAEQAGITTASLDHRQFESREAFDFELQQQIDAYRPELVVLAGFMRILSSDFVNHYSGRMLNIHPSLLPKFRGLKTHQRAIEAGEAEHGASVHFVSAELDGGPVVLQAVVPVKPDDSADRLAQRVLVMEHNIYPLAIAWFAQGRLTLTDQQAHLDGRPIDQPRRFYREDFSDEAATLV